MDIPRTANFDMQDTVLKTMPGAVIFDSDMLFDIPYIADPRAIGQRRQVWVDRNNVCRIDFDYAVGHKVVIWKDGNIYKAKDK